jgi:tetratricopeptide (TPR) repeat protein
MIKTCAILFAFSYLTVFLVYSTAYASEGKGVESILFSTIHAIFSSARMFFTSDDFPYLNDINAAFFFDDIWIQTLFWFCHTLSLFVTASALIAVFGRNLIDRARMHIGLYRNVYIIIGLSQESILLGRNIVTHDGRVKRPDSDRLVVFLIDQDDDQKQIHEKVSGFGGIVIPIDDDNDLLFAISKTYFGRWRGKNKKYKFIFMQNEFSHTGSIMNIAEFAKEKKNDDDRVENKAEFYIFTEKEWEKDSIEKLSGEKDNVTGKRKYPHTFHIADEIEISTRQLISVCPPYKCLAEKNVFENARAKRDFTVMILGFGRIGHRSLLRLIQNGQFAGSRMRAIVVDQEADHLRERFLHRYPSLDMCCKIDFRNIDVRDKAFFDLLEEAGNIDYIVAALSNDEMSRQAAKDIRLYYERKNIKLPFIAIAVYEKDSGLQNTGQDENVFSFGCREDVYKEAIIIREETDRMARAVYDVYTEGKKEKIPWHEVDLFEQESNRASADFIPAMLALAGLKEEDARKKKTLTEDHKLAENLAITEHLRWNAFHAAMGYRPMGIEEMRRRFEKYQGDPKEHLNFCRKDPKNRLHVCFVSWDELDKISEAYRELEKRADKKPERDFKKNDRSIIENIPDFLNKKEEDGMTTLMQDGIAHIRANDYDAAIADFTKVIKAKPKNAAAWYGRGCAWHRKGKRARACSDFKKAVKLAPDNSRYQAALEKA